MTVPENSQPNPQPRLHGAQPLDLDAIRARFDAYVDDSGWLNCGKGRPHAPGSQPVAEVPATDEAQ